MVVQREKISGNAAIDGNRKAIVERAHDERYRRRQRTENHLGPGRRGRGIKSKYFNNVFFHDQLRDFVESDLSKMTSVPPFASRINSELPRNRA